ncbi:MAG: D-alanyl-D-alanine carboxypeptidase family protein [Ruminococcus sp.]|nr:D-alanyl-D-alanine carboxypeptidase family protein [Ruminococcus sp.]MDE6848282.1 D-alanyl-D-alanine carboxypeptidase family protein [Ruminococcus sp.]
MYGDEMPDVTIQKVKTAYEKFVNGIIGFPITFEKCITISEEMIMVNTRLRKGRLIITMFIIAGVLFAADALRRALFMNTDPNIIVDNGIVKTYNTGGNPEADSLENPDMINQQAEVPDGYAEFDISATQLVSGTLVYVDYEHPYVSLDMMPAVNLVYYRNDYYTLVNETDPVILNEEAATALNFMMADYHKSTGRSNFLVYGTTDTYTGEGSYCPQFFPESSTGNTIDLAVNVGASVLTYDGCDDEKWIVDNCHNYGYIVRYPEGKADITGTGFCPWHLRYIGKIHASIMKDLKLCFEEYIEFLGGFTFDHPLSYNLDGTLYDIYSVKSTGEITSAYVPVSRNYVISGTNTDSFIITSIKC